VQCKYTNIEFNFKSGDLHKFNERTTRDALSGPQRLDS